MSWSKQRTKSNYRLIAISPKGRLFLELGLYIHGSHSLQLPDLSPYSRPGPWQITQAVGQPAENRALQAPCATSNLKMVNPTTADAKTVQYLKCAVECTANQNTKVDKENQRNGVFTAKKHKRLDGRIAHVH